MGIASFSPTGLLGSFQGLVGWLTASAPNMRASRPSPASRPAAAWVPNRANHPSPSPAWPARPSCSAAPPVSPRRPVRVLRVIDTPLVATSAGRMRISGRMADVCAELERMAAMESAPRSGTQLQ